jgi:hypothetical protein
MTTWVSPLIAHWRTGALNADEVWTVVLDCFELEDPKPVVDSVLRGLTWLPPTDEQQAVVGLETGEFVVVEFDGVTG